MSGLPPLVESPLQKEQRLFGELSNRLGNTLLNRVFDLRPDRAARRLRYLTILFFVSGFLISLRYYSIVLWAQQIQELFLYLFNSAYAANYVGDPFTKFALFVYHAFSDPQVFQYLPIFLAPFFIALQSAAIYLGDVFELEDVGVARSFIWEVALSGGNNTIRISQGEVSTANRESPTFLIGGPGKVIVDLDTVALFEKPDGTPHVIGPTGQEPGGRATLDGFERFRQAIDIRDHYVDLRDQDSKSKSVVSRSRDGIPITATDVRLMFSIDRGLDPKPSAAVPYPFDQKAIQQIVYNATSKVTPGQLNPSAHEFEWTNNMIGLIRSELSGFMSKHNLSVYLATTGMPELEKIKQREEAIAEQIRNLAQTDEEKPKAKDDKGPPEFQPRHKITNLFTQFAHEFTDKSRGKGVELHWIGVGTWKSLIELVPEKHLEAWKISQENLNSDSPGAMKGAEEKARIDRMVVLIDAVPLAAYHDFAGAYRSSKKTGKKQETRPQSFLKEKKLAESALDADILFSDEELQSNAEEVAKFIKISRLLQEEKARQEADYYRDPDQKEAIQSLLLEYRKQFKETADFIKDKKEVVPSNILEGIQYIDEQLNFIHWVGRSQPNDNG
ncbi:MAG TPA: hypothetical protein VN653_09425 [Anaerolineales bacterium]|nr:hypothetical protein [Anaerolineales bacterium]